MPKSVTPLETVDNAFGNVIAACYDAMNPQDGTKAFRRFVQRPPEDRIYACKNDDVQATLRKLARLRNEPGKTPPDLPVIVYYREQGITADMNQHVQVADVTRFLREDTCMCADEAMQITTLPLTLTYSVLFLAWDRATIDAMALAWWAYMAPLHRKHSRFLVPYVIDGERFEVGASINAPREILTSFEPMDGDQRLWGSRTAVEVTTQAVYGAKVQALDYLRIQGTFGELYA